jgi:hypothetical protein
VILVLGMLVLPSAAAAADFAWNGATALGVGAGNWSNGTNWLGGTAPSAAVGTLSFPALTSTACTSMPRTDTCYLSTNNVSGISASGISIDDGVAYNLSGDGLTLGSGGITAAPSASDNASVTDINIPLTLNATQTWSVTGGCCSQQLVMGASITQTAGNLAVALSDGGLAFNDDAEVGPATVTGSGFIGLGVPGGSPGSLNGTDGNAVSLGTGTSLQVSGAGSKIGALSLSGNTLLQVGLGMTPDATLAVDGGVTLGFGTDVEIAIDQAGTTPSTDYSQLTATGTVDLGSANLLLGKPGPCPTLNPGDVDTLISTTGSLTGTFAGIANGDVISLICSGPGPAVRINYTSNSVTATALTTTSTSLSANPATPVTNQGVTLTATVTPSSPTPSGTVQFDNNGAPISGCSSQPVAFDGSSYTATCQTSFTAASSPESLTATFTSSNPSVSDSETIAPNNLVIGQDSTTTTLAISNASPTTGQNVTYTATVTPAHTGSTEPSGSVTFTDGGAPIGSCSSQSLTAGPSSSTACALSYSAAGSHNIAASYTGDSNFTGSSSSAQTVTVQSPSPLPTKPSSTSAPVASGTPTVGQTISGSTGGWAGTTPISYTYQWQLCNPGCANIAGAISSSYTLLPADAGAKLLVLVTATNSGGSAQTSSNELGPVMPNTAQILAALSAVLSPRGKNASIEALLRNGGFTLTFAAPGSGTLTITWFYVPQGAHVSKAKKKPNPVPIASGRLSFSKAGTSTVKIRLTGKGKQLLKHAKSLRVTSKATFAPTSGNSGTRQTTFKLKR